VLLGAVLGASRWASRLAGPSFHAYRQVAVFAWIPLISAWFGGGESTKVAFIAVAAVSPVVVNTIEGVRAVAREHVELARVLEIGRLRFATRILFPSAAPQILTGLHLSLITAWVATFGSEFFLQIAPGASRILIEGRALGRMDLVLVGIAVNGLIGFGLNTAIVLVERRVLRWRPAGPSTANE
jgi:sulfonate transport system permease protein